MEGRSLGMRILCALGAVMIISGPAVWPVQALDDSVGAPGINAAATGLTGAGIRIGQVELSRPGRPGFDNAANSHPNVNPAAVYYRAGAATANFNVDGHAERVAGVMISTHPTYKGVAPSASLYSSGYDVAVGNGQMQASVSMQHVARQAVRAINLSFGEFLADDPRPNPVLDGNGLISQFVDWSARVHNVLYCIANHEDVRNTMMPQDSYNGIVVSATEKGAGGEYTKVAGFNNFAGAFLPAGRRKPDVVAPGHAIDTPTLGGGTAKVNGTSYAAPHVTGTVALLQQYGEARIGNPRWDGDHRNHEVMKAVIMNSANKVKDSGDGKLLGMSKTITTIGGTDWLASDAYTDTFQPLARELGTGQIDALRAVTQLSSGEWDSHGSATVPLIGWDFGVTLGVGDIVKYIFDKPLIRDSYVSITLAWDRRVELNDFGADGLAGTGDAGEGDGLYTIGESFTTIGLNDLDLYLLPKGAASTAQAISSSRSVIDSVEHIFFKIPADGDYEFWVRRWDNGAQTANQFYGVAWWAVPEPVTVVLLMLGSALLRRRSR